jgi:hypothetical protein
LSDQISFGSAFFFCAAAAFFGATFGGPIDAGDGPVTLTGPSRP